MGDEKGERERDCDDEGGLGVAGGGACASEVGQGWVLGRGGVLLG